MPIWSPTQKIPQAPPPPPPPAKPLFLFPPFPSPFDCCLLHQLFLKMVESFQFYYTFVLTTYMALGCQYISSVPTAITDHNMTQGSQDISWSHTWSTDLVICEKVFYPFIHDAKSLSVALSCLSCRLSNCKKQLQSHDWKVQKSWSPTKNEYEDAQDTVSICHDL